MVGLGIGSLTRGLRRQMKTYSYIVTVSLLSVGFIVMCGLLASLVHYEYRCINGVLMERVNNSMWVSSPDYPKYCVDQEKVQ